MNKKQFEECFERLNKYVFSRDMAVKEDWYDFLNYHHNQLQSYKDKEYKLRDLVEEYKYIYYTEDESVEDCVIQGKYILQILNEGSDK